jgi:hypothetical protein
MPTKLRTRRQTAAPGLGAAEYVSLPKVLTEAEVIEALSNAGGNPYRRAYSV